MPGVVLGHARLRQFLSQEHFSVDGTLIEAWASMKSFRPKDGGDEPPDGGWNSSRKLPWRATAQRHSCLDDRCRSAAVPQRRGQGGQALLHGPPADGEPLGSGGRAAADQATGLAEREAASALLEDLPGRHRITVGADRAYDTSDFVAALRQLNATPHVAQNLSRRASRIDRRTVRHPGYWQASGARKRIEEAFAWIKTIALQAKTSFRGTARVGWAFTLAAAAFNLIRLMRLDDRLVRSGPERLAAATFLAIVALLTGC